MMKLGVVEAVLIVGWNGAQRLLERSLQELEIKRIIETIASGVNNGE